MVMTMEEAEHYQKWNRISFVLGAVTISSIIVLFAFMGRGYFIGVSIMGMCSGILLGMPMLHRNIERALENITGRKW